MKSLTSFLFLIFLSFSFLGCNKSYATRELPMVTAEAARSSSDIIVARCVASEVKKDEKTGLLFTYTTFEIDQSLKEKYDTENVVLRIVGGNDGHISVNVPDRPEFVNGEDVVLFLGPENTAGYPVLHSFNRGVYRIKLDESGNKIVSTPVNGLDIYRKGSNERVASREKLLLKDFIYSLNQEIK